MLGVHCCTGFFLVVVSRGYSLVVVQGLLIAVASLVVEHRLNSCSSQALEHRLSSCGAWGLAALQHVGSSQTRDQTCISCISRWILYHWPPGKPPKGLFKPPSPFFFLTKNRNPYPGLRGIVIEVPRLSVLVAPRQIELAAFRRLEIVHITFLKTNSNTFSSIIPVWSQGFTYKCVKD